MQSMNTITASDINAMRREQDEAAREFWAYPDHEWQVAFQTKWLVAHGFAPKVTIDGLTWGEAGDAPNQSEGK